jgi:Holliday junction DNA helicase RuvA
MIAAVKGQLEYTGLDYVLINVNGVSLRLFVPLSLLEDLGEIGREVKLYTHLYVREDQLALYGFKSNDQQDLFEMLIGVAGVGPKAALSMLSAAEVGAIHLAIAQSNVDFLKKVPGIGPKTAARIILELKGKLVDIDKTSRTAVKVGDPKQAAITLERQQVVAALSGLGYNPTEIQAALTSLPTEQPLTIEEQVLGALRYLGQ